MTLYRKIFITKFNLRFGSPRSDTWKQCDQFYARLILADSEDECKKIECESKIHHMKAEGAYKNLTAESSNRILSYFVLTYNRYYCI